VVLADAAAIIAAEANRHVGATHSCPRLGSSWRSQPRRCEPVIKLRSYLEPSRLSEQIVALGSNRQRFRFSSQIHGFEGQVLSQGSLIAPTDCHRQFSSPHIGGKMEALEPDDGDDYGRKSFLRLYGRICSTHSVFYRS
jgi:hypothetical protein